MRDLLRSLANTSRGEPESQPQGIGLGDRLEPIDRRHGVAVETLLLRGRISGRVLDFATEHCGGRDGYREAEDRAD